MDRQQQFVLRTLEETGHPLRPAVVHRRARIPEVGGDRAGRTGGGVRRRASASTDPRSRASPGSTSPTWSPSPTRRRSRCCPGRRRAARTYSARMFCDIAMPDGSPSWADPRHVLRRVMGDAAAMGFTCYVHPEIEFFLLQRPARRRLGAGTCRPRRILRPGLATTWRRTSAAGRSRPWSRWGSRWSSPTTRGRRASRRSTCATPTR